MERLELRALISVCTGLAHDACGVIRAVQQLRESGGELLSELKDQEDDRTYLTVADQRAQKVVIAGLRASFGDALDIVGEEDEDEDAVPDDGAGAAPVPAPGSREEGGRGCSDYQIPSHLEDLTVEDVCVFIDPLDGTREFVKGRIEAVQCLIGIAYRGRPIAGIIGLPFLRTASGGGGDGDSAVTVETSEIHIIYGVAGSAQGVVGVPLPGMPAAAAAVASSSGMTLAISSDLGKGTAVAVVPKVIEKVSVGELALLTAGASGNKVLKVLTGECDAAVLNLKTSLWDTCATEALVLAAGGIVTNLFGWPIEHVSVKYRQTRHRSATSVDLDPPPSDDKRVADGLYGNRLGVFVTGPGFPARCKEGRTHVEICKTFFAANPVVDELLHADRGWSVGKAVEARGTLQASDIARTIWGDPFTCASLQKLVVPSSTFADGAQIDHYWTKDAEAVRYKQSHASRISWVYADPGANDAADAPGAPAATTSDATTALPTSAFMKRMVLRELPHAIKKLSIAPYKLQRDMAANINEARFLASPLAKQFNEMAAGATQQCEIAAAYSIEQHLHSDYPIDSRFSLLLKDFNRKDGWLQRVHLEAGEFCAALQALAQWHAFFWIQEGGAGSTCAAQHHQDGSVAELGRQLWPTASYWDLDKQPEGQVEGLGLAFERIVAVMVDSGLMHDDADALHVGGSAHWLAVGARLQRVAQSANDRLHAAPASKTSPTTTTTFTKQTLLHGDPKASNFFFKPAPVDAGVSDLKHGSDPASATAGVGLIDFQWSGRGLCATDVAYCVLASADPAAMFKDPAKYAELDERVRCATAPGVATGSSASVGAGGAAKAKAKVFALDGDDLEDEEEHLLRYYFDKLSKSRGSSAGGTEDGGSLSYEMFRSQYRDAFVDVCRVCLGSWWNIPGNHRSNASPTIVDVIKARQAMPEKQKMVYTACNKHLTLACWMLRRMRAYLQEFEEI